MSRPGWFVIMTRSAVRGDRRPASGDGATAPNGPMRARRATAHNWRSGPASHGYAAGPRCHESHLAVLAKRGCGAGLHTSVTGFQDM
jgi:hypothetical protein